MTNLSLEQVIRKISKNSTHRQNALVQSFYDSSNGVYRVGGNEVTEEEAERHLANVLTQTGPAGMLTVEQRNIASHYRPKCEHIEAGKNRRAIGRVATAYAVSIGLLVGSALLSDKPPEYDDGPAVSQEVRDESKRVLNMLGGLGLMASSLYGLGTYVKRKLE